MARPALAERKISHHISLTPRETSFVAREARRLQVSGPEILRRLIDREIERELNLELARDKQKLNFKAHGSG